MSKLKIRNSKLKKIISFVLVGVLLIGVISSVSLLFNKDTVKISASAFTRGSINEKGNYTESNLSIYTKNLIECEGLSIEPDFEATGSFQVFYYDVNKNYIDSTDILNVNDGVYNKGDTFSNAKYCRIVITPSIPVDEDGKSDDDFKIRFYEVSKYAREYNITVNKKQSEWLTKWRTISLTDDERVTTFEDVYYKGDGTQSSGAGYVSYVFTATNDCKVYVDSEISVFQYVVKRIDGTSQRYQKTDGTYVGGENYSYELSSGDQFIISYNNEMSGGNVTVSDITFCEEFMIKK